MNIIHVFFLQNLFVMANLSQGLGNNVDHDVSLQVQGRHVGRLIGDTESDTESLCGIYSSISAGNRNGFDQLTYNQVKDCCCQWGWFKYPFQQQNKLGNLDLSDYTKVISHDILRSHDIAREPKHNTRKDEISGSRYLHTFNNKHLIFKLIKSGRQNYRTCRSLKNLKGFCDRLKQQKNEDFTLRFSVRHRKLLQTETEGIPDSDNNAAVNSEMWIEVKEDGNVLQRNSTFNGLSYKQWREFIAALQRNMSRDHVWAMLSLVCLIVVMMFAMKVCGLKPMNRSHERHLDYVFRESNHHTASIREILALKRPYLPKSIVRLSKRWRWKRKKRTVKFQERDIADAMSDNSEEERLIYSAPFMDF